MELFQAKRTLVLQLDDAATSDDPLEIFLQRKGWKLKRVNALQYSISKKLTVGMFTNDTEPLTGAELMLQEDVNAFIRQAQPRQTA